MPGAPLLLFAPGAGAPSTSAWMAAWAARLATLGSVVRLDYPYQLAGRRRPDPLPRLIEAHREALAAARAAHPAARPLVLCGKSMGSRVGCHLSLTEAGIDGLVCLGYPLRGAGRAGRLRDQVLLELRVPALFVQGTRDPLCPLELLEEVRARMAAPGALHVVPEGDHSLEVTKRHLKATGTTQEDSDAAVLAAIRSFVAGLG